MSFSKDVRRDQVVTASLKLIGKSGLSGLTTAAIAKEVGISEANIYRHFHNKQEILSETIKRIGEGLKSNVEIAIESSSGPLNCLRQVFQLHLRYVERNPRIPRLLFSDDIHTNDSEMKPRLLAMVAGYMDSLERIVRGGIEIGEIRESVDPKATALTFIGMIQVSIIRWILSDFTLSIENEGLSLWDNYVACISVSVCHTRDEPRSSCS
jgi:AcrR family transcriptional regulator